MRTVGKAAREAFILMKYLMSAAEIQFRMESTGGELIEIPAEVCARGPAGSTGPFIRAPRPELAAPM